MLSLTTLVVADEGEYVPSEAILEYTPEQEIDVELAPEFDVISEQESEQDTDVPEGVVDGDDYVEDTDVGYPEYDTDEASYEDYYYYEYDYEDKYEDEEEYIFIWGDVNNDGVVDSADVELLIRYIGNISPLPTINMYAFNEYGIVNSDNLSELIRYVYNIGHGIRGASFGRGLVGPEAIWRLSHETILPNATYVDVRLYLHQNPTVSTNPHGGIDISFIRFAYDPTILSINNATFAPRTEYFDFDLLDDEEQASFDATVAAFMGFPFFMTYEEANAQAKDQAMFAHAWIRSNVPNHEGFNVAIHLSEETVGAGGHVLGANIVQVFFSPGDNHNPHGHPYVYIRFNVAAGFNTPGDSTILTMPPPGVVQDMAGDITVVSVNGSVTIGGFNIAYTANAQSGGTVSNMPANHIGLSPGTHSTRTQEPTHTNVDRNGVSTVVQFVGWSQTQTNHIFAAGERALLPADWIPAGGNVTITNADVTLYAIWGWSTDGNLELPPDVLRDGVMLYVNNWPNFDERPAGQTASASHTIGATVPLTQGVAVNWEFLGWVRGTDVTLPAPNTNWAVWSAAQPAGVVHNAPHSATIPATGSITYTAVWGNDGYVGANLVIRNHPAVNVTGQTETQARPVPSAGIALQSGTATGWEFLGWVRGNDNLPASGANWTEWSAANPARVLTAPYTTGAFTQPETAHIYTAIWGNRPGNGDNGDPIVGANLVIRNHPSISIVAGSQIPTQYVPYQQTVNLAPVGTPVSDWVFFGWVRGENLPPLNADWNEWSTNPANAAFVYVAGAQVGPFASNESVMFTAIWGNYDGDGNGDNGNGGTPRVGANLVVRNQPAVNVTDQTPSQAVPAGQTRTLAQGTAGDWGFIGWVRGNVVPETGTYWADFVAANPGVTFPAGHTTAAFVADTVVRYTAIWGDPRTGLVGANLIIDNIPAKNPLPTNQTPSQVVYTDGTTVELAHGTLPATSILRFGGWVRGTENLPALGTLLAEWVDANPGLLHGENHLAGPFAEREAIQYTAIWICDEGYVGGAQLFIHNVPEQAVRPAGQTPTQPVSVGEHRILAHGAAPAGLLFGTWIRGDVVPPEGAVLTEWLAANPTVPNFGAGHRTATFAYRDVFIYTAIWVCTRGIIGGGNLFIYNVPAQAVSPVGQTPAYQRVPIGEYRTLAEGAAPAGPVTLYFGTWIRGNVVPEVGDYLADWLAENPTVEYFEAGHETNVFVEGSRYVYHAIWVCEHGFVGGGGYRSLRIYYYTTDGENGLERDMENNPYGRQYFAPIGSIFSTENVLYRNDLDSDNEYVFQGWLVHIGGLPYQYYLENYGKNTDELHGYFTVPAPRDVSPLAVLATIDALNASVVGDDISLVALWLVYEAEEVPPKRLPQTGIESSLLLWVALLSASMLIGFGALSGLKKSKNDDEAY